MALYLTTNGLACSGGSRAPHDPGDAEHEPCASHVTVRWFAHDE